MSLLTSSFLNSKSTRILTAVLVCQAVVSYGFSRKEVIPKNLPLSQAPAQFGKWQMISEGVVEKETQDVLKADEILTRTYGLPGTRQSAHLFVAYFRSQRTGQAPHSPKNCLPGSGWIQNLSDRISIDVPGRQPIEVNRYVVQKGENKSLVLYWYQSRDRVVASEYSAKAFVVADAIRYNRTDTALVRVVVPMEEGDDAASSATAVDFVKSFFTPLRAHFPA
jgi:EpsI family protein